MVVGQGQEDRRTPVLTPTITSPLISRIGGLFLDLRRTAARMVHRPCLGRAWPAGRTVTGFHGGGGAHTAA